MLREAFEAKRVRLQQATPLENPELVLVLEVVGMISNFAKAVSKIPELEWLYEFAQDHIEQDEDFQIEAKNPDAALSGRLYLLGSNQEALNQLLALWHRYERDTSAHFDRGLAPFKDLFKHLRAIRPWNASDRVDVDMRSYWTYQVDSGRETCRFEIEAWYFNSNARNDATHTEIAALVGQLQGQVLRTALIPEIAYHGFLVEVPTATIRSILDGAEPKLLLSDRIMFFRPKAQSINGDHQHEEEPGRTDVPPPIPNKLPVVALLDGLPLANHALLAGRLVVDDPDGWEGNYEAKDRVHGTAMASLILHGGDLANAPPTDRPLYVRPVMRPDPNDTFNARRTEQTPDDVLLIDLIHRSVKRICEGEAGQQPAAPSVRVINLSIGDSERLFARGMSPWARLLDWLAHRYRVLFIVSAGNDSSPLTIAAARGSLGVMTNDARQALAFSALVAESTSRRLMSPAESINALTVGALHADPVQAPTVPNRFDLFAPEGISPISRVGHGYRRAVKPDILMPGGRTLHMERFVGPVDVSVVELVRLGSPPGHRTAIPPMPGGALDQTSHCRGTSNAAALASRAAMRAFDVLEELRGLTDRAPGPAFDAVVLKALLVHGASWGSESDRLIAERTDLAAIADAHRRRAQQQDFVTRWLGYGAADVERAITCTEQRATLLGAAEIAVDKALEFSAPLPPSLSGRREWRRITITLAWISPTNPTHQAYRRAKLWISRPGEELLVKRTRSVDFQTAMRGTVQHEILEGDDALAYVDGARFVCKVNCAADAGGFTGTVRFAVCVSLEVGIQSGIPVYQEMRDRITPPIPVQPV